MAFFFVKKDQFIEKNIFYLNLLDVLVNIDYF